MRSSSRTTSKLSMKLNVTTSKDRNEGDLDINPQVPWVRRSGRIKTRALTLTTALSSLTLPPVHNETLPDPNIVIIADNDMETIASRVHSRRERSTTEAAVHQLGNELLNNHPTQTHENDTNNDIVILDGDYNNAVIPDHVNEVVDIYRESYVFPAVRGIPSSEEVHTLIVKLFGLIIKHMSCIQLKHNDDMKKAIHALYFLPCILRYKRGQRHHMSIIKDLNMIIGISSLETVEAEGFYNGVNAILKKGLDQEIVKYPINIIISIPLFQELNVLKEPFSIPEMGNYRKR